MNLQNGLFECATCRKRTRNRNLSFGVSVAVCQGACTEAMIAQALSVGDELVPLKPKVEGPEVQAEVPEATQRVIDAAYTQAELELEDRDAKVSDDLLYAQEG